jgi:hypothetical protein
VPILIAGFSLLLGLPFALILWVDILACFRILVVLVTPVGCMFLLTYFHERRKHLRERELLREVKRGWRKGPGLRTISLILPATATVIVVIFLYSLISFEDLWRIVSTFTMKGRPELGEGIRQRFITVFPFISLIGYLFVTLSFAASSTLMLVRVYINRLKTFLPPPIFLQDELLARVVRREAETELGRQNPESLNPGGSNRSAIAYANLPATSGQHLAKLIPPPPQFEFWVHAATWVWDELTRTKDGGIEMKVARDEVYQLPKPAKDSGHVPSARVTYVVRADPWGRIREIKREAEE